VDKMTQSSDPEAWQPENNTQCTIFGENMGTDETKKKALGILEKMTLRLEKKRVKF
jgi:hypothetical protein